MTEAPIPSVIAMLVCDQIIVEQGSGKKSLIGIFENIMTVAFPSVLARVSIYARLMDAVGHYDFQLKLVHLKNEENELAKVEISADVKDRLSATELGINM